MFSTRINVRREEILTRKEFETNNSTMCSGDDYTVVVVDSVRGFSEPPSFGYTYTSSVTDVTVFLTSGNRDFILRVQKTVVVPLTPTD